MDVILLFPGQGSQKPGMGQELAARYPEARETFERVDAALGVPLSRLCFEGPAEELTQTHNAQPALLAHGAAAWQVVREALAPYVRAAAGHSLGEITAYEAADALSLEDAVRLVRRRGELMYEVGIERPGTMAAILGATAEPIDVLCARAAEETGVVVAANYNADEQVVISGEVAAVERAMELAKAAGAKRVMRLIVSGAFHSPLMAPAAERFGEALRGVDWSAPAFPIYANVTAEPCTTAADATALLFQQLTSPVQWVRSVRALAARYPSALYVELGPGTVLAGLVGRIVPEARTISCGTPADVDKLLAMAA